MTDEPDKPYLLVGCLNQMVCSVHQGIWGLHTPESLASVQDPYFLGRCFSDSVIEGDQIMFSCGPEGARIHGTLVVTAVKRAESGEFGEVYTLVLNSTAPPRTRLKVVS